MSYLRRTTIGFGLIVAAWVIFGYSLYKLLQIGTCASGGPYEVARECPSGTGRLGLLLPGSIIVLLIGSVMYARRGKAPGSDRPPHAGLLITWFWTGIFWSAAVGCLLGVWGPEANPGPGAKTGGLIVAFLFLPMGAIGLLGLGSGRGKKKDKGSAPAAAGLSDPPSFPGAKRAAKAVRSRLPSEDPVDRIERLNRLRERGAITQEEFDVLKRQALGGGR